MKERKAFVGGEGEYVLKDSQMRVALRLIHSDKTDAFHFFVTNLHFSSTHFSLGSSFDRLEALGTFTPSPTGPSSDTTQSFSRRDRTPFGQKTTLTWMRMVRRLSRKGGREGGGGCSYQPRFCYIYLFNSHEIASLSLSCVIRYRNFDITPFTI